MAVHPNIAYVVNLVIAVGLAFGLYSMLRQSLRALLDRVVRLPAGTQFYLRGLLLTFLLLALSNAVGNQLDLKPNAHFMEYVWAIAGNLAHFFENVVAGLLAYIAMVTILVAVLKVKND